MFQTKSRHEFEWSQEKPFERVHDSKFTTSQFFLLGTKLYGVIRFLGF